MYLKYIFIAITSYQVMVVYGIRPQHSPYNLVIYAMKFKLISGWYLEMFLTLYLLSPFISLILAKLSKKEMQSLIFILVLVIGIPAFVNANPLLNKFLILPNYWSNIYPIVYYMIGNYIFRYEKDITVSTAILKVSCIISIIVIFLLIFLSAQPVTYAADGYYGSILQIVYSTSFYLIMLRFNKFPSSKIVNFVSKHTLSIYLVSLPVDRIMYDIIGSRLSSNFDFFKIAPIVIMVCYISSALIGILYDLFFGLVLNFKDKVL